MRSDIFFQEEGYEQEASTGGATNNYDGIATTAAGVLHPCV
jgi:hypothetical protein